MTKVPSAATRAKARFGSTSTLAYICSWMLQNTSTRPGLGKLTVRASWGPGWPRSKSRAVEVEKTLCTNGSSLVNCTD